MPDATGLELLAQDLREAHADAVLDTVHFRGKGTLVVEPAPIAAVLQFLKGRGFTFLASVHGVDYYPDEPRLGVHYEMLDMHDVDRLTVKVRVPTDDPRVPSVTPCPSAAAQAVRRRSSCGCGCRTVGTSEAR